MEPYCPPPGTKCSLLTSVTQRWCSGVRDRRMIQKHMLSLHPTMLQGFGTLALLQGLQRQADQQKPKD